MFMVNKDEYVFAAILNKFFDSVSSLALITFVYVQWLRYRGFRRFNEPEPPSSWGPRAPSHKKFYAMAKFTYDYNMIFYITCNMEK